MFRYLDTCRYQMFLLQMVLIKNVWTVNCNQYYNTPTQTDPPNTHTPHAEKKSKCDVVRFNPLPNDKIFHWSKLKAFADDKINVTEILKFVLETVENIVGKGENAGYQHFLLLLQCFQKASNTGSLKVGIVW